MLFKIILKGLFFLVQRTDFINIKTPVPTYNSFSSSTASVQEKIESVNGSDILLLSQYANTKAYVTSPVFLTTILNRHKITQPKCYKGF